MEDRKMEYQYQLQGPSNLMTKNAHKNNRYTLLRLISSPSHGKRAFLNYHLVRRKYILKHVCELFDKNSHEPAPLLNKTLLDIGCGSSHLAEEMTFRGADATAIDTNKKAIKKAKIRSEKSGALVTFRNDTTATLAKEKQKYDVILCLDILDHTSRKSDLLKDIHTLLADDGILIISANNRTLKSFLWHKVVASFLFRWIPGGYTFRHFMTPDKLAKKLEKTGFVTQDQCGVYLDESAMRWRRQEKPGIRFLTAAVKNKA